jgi:hypothetical protein
LLFFLFSAAALSGPGDPSSGLATASGQSVASASTRTRSLIRPLPHASVVLAAMLLVRPASAATPVSEAGAQTPAPEHATTAPSVKEAPAPAQPKPGGLWGPRFGARHWEIGVGIDYARATGSVFGIELEPNTLGLSLAASYLFSGGLRLGIIGDVYKGKTVSQIYEPPLTAREIPLDAESQLADVGLLIGYDHPLGPVVLRYAVATNLGILSWDFGDVPADSIGAFTPMQGSEFVFNLDTSLGVVWPIHWFFVSTQVHYRLPISSYLAGSFGGGVGLGVQF